MQPKIGDVVWWTSIHGYSACGGERGEVYAIDVSRRVACINTAGDEQNPDGYSYPVSFDELSPMPAQSMTFDEFRATGRDVPDLGTIEHCAAQEISGPGRVYLDDDWPLVIEGRGPWYLTIGNSSEMYGPDALESAERKLYEFAVSEGYIDA